MIWTMELASYLEDAPWPATKEELIDYAVRTGTPIEVLENLQELEDSDDHTRAWKKSGLTTRQTKIFSMKTKANTNSAPPVAYP